MRPLLIPSYIKDYLSVDKDDESVYEIIRENYKKLTGYSVQPVISVIIPAHNEEKNIVNTLFSLCNNITEYPVEIIVVSNNSSDRTEHYVWKCGTKCVHEQMKGIVFARTKGLMEASGKIIINADADTLYPPHWIEKMAAPLLNRSDVACTYGKFAFIPTKGYSRLSFYTYEIGSDIFKFINGRLKDKAMYVYGCTSAYRKNQALQVNAYEHPSGANEDGYLGLKLRNRFGKLLLINDKDVFVWTSSRKFIADGKLINRVFRKMKSIINL